MGPNDLVVDVRHHAAEQRFEAIVEGQLCVLNYRLVGNVMRIHHTGVPAALEGRGIASKLASEALAHADANGLRVEPWCGFVHAYIQRHPETQRLLAPRFAAGA